MFKNSSFQARARAPFNTFLVFFNFITALSFAQEDTLSKDSTLLHTHKSNDTTIYTIGSIVLKGNKKTKSLVIYGAGKAGLQLQREFLSSEYKLICFIDDDEILHHRSIDGISIYSKEKYCSLFENQKFDLMIYQALDDK